MKYLQIPGSPVREKRVRALFKKFIPILFAVTFLAVIGIVVATLFGSSSVFKFAFGDFSKVKSTDGRVNILLLGIAGGIHDGANLTDTIMVASYNLKSQEVDLISIPRDLWLDSLKNKVNAAYEIGLSKGDGLGYAKQIIGDALGVPIHYGIRVDFRGFIKALDEVGGVDVVVDNPFDDYLYPIEGKENDLCGFKEEERDFNADDAQKLNISTGKRTVLIAPDGKIATDSAEPNRGYEYFSCRYEHISFTAGSTHMDGTIALKYVRSRMGANGEGSDFARSKRQQKVLKAFRDKVLSLDTLTSPSKIKGLAEAFGKSIDIDIPLDDALEFRNFSQKINKTQNFILGEAEGKQLLVNPPTGDYGAWVLVPKDDNFNEVRDYVKKILTGKITEYEATISARTSGF